MTSAFFYASALYQEEMSIKMSKIFIEMMTFFVLIYILTLLLFVCIN